MKSNRFIKTIIIIMLGIAILVSGIFVFNKITDRGSGEHVNNSVFIGDVPISEYRIVSKSGTDKESRLLADYIYKSTGTRLKISRFHGKRNIFLSTDSETDSLRIEKGDVYILSSKDLNGLVDIAANSFFGYAFAGTDSEHFLYTEKEILLPKELSINSDSGWMPEREPIVCLWDPSAPRGVYKNINTAKEIDILSFSDDMLYDYVKTMQHMGFTGIQVTDICAAWAEFGSYEYVQERLGFIADAAHSLGMTFTLWVWGSEFNGYGWKDLSVSYHGYTEEDTDIEAVRATYEKYYGIYSGLADRTDRLIIHFFEPGHVYNMKNTAFCTRMLYDKFTAVNPDVKVGINVYSHYFDFYSLYDELGDIADRITYYTLPADGMDNYANVRTAMLNRGVDYGIWSWGLIEREIDQTAAMNVNASVIKKAYTSTREYDYILKPDYWSEMDSYHILNYFSLYVSSHLLMDPDADSEELLHDAAERITGEKYADDLYFVLKLIESARSGESAESFREGDQNVIFSKDYPASSIYESACKAELILDELAAASDIKTSVPFPIGSKRLFELIKTHVTQIKSYADFRLRLDELREEAESLSAAELRNRLTDIYVMIPEGDSVTGVWGVSEQRAETQYVNGFCREFGLEPVYNASVDEGRKARIYGEFESLQANSATRLEFDPAGGFQMGVAFGETDTERLVFDLVKEGILSLSESGKVYITEWEKLSRAD